MKKLILCISIILLPIISYSQEVARSLVNVVNADLLEGKGAAHFIDTTSTAQTKLGKLTISLTDADGGGSGLYVNNIFTKVGVIAHKAILSNLTYTPASIGTACPISIVGKVNLNGNLTAANAYPGMGWGVQGQIHMVTGSTINGNQYGSPGAVYAGLRGVVTDDGTSTYTKGALTGLYSEIQMTQTNANDGADFNIYGAWIRSQGTATATDIAAGLYIDANPSFPNTFLKGIDINDAITGIDISNPTLGINIDQSPTGNSYTNAIFNEWTAGADMVAGGSNGIYSISNPVKDVNNVYSLRGRMDLRDASATVDVNQLHAIDALINFNESHAYDVVDNISVVGAAVHGAGANITGDGVLEEESLNLFYGVWGPTATQNFEITTNGMLLLTHAATHMDYGVTVENSGTMAAGIYLDNHSSNSPAIMTSGILMKSASGKMAYGINMTDASITTADMLFQNGATVENIETDTLMITETVVKVEGDLVVTGDWIHEKAGGLSYVSTPGQMTIATGGTFEKLYEDAIAYTAGHLFSFTESNGRLTYTGTPTIHATIMVNTTLEGDEAAQLIQIRIAENGTPIAGTNMQCDWAVQDSDLHIGTNWLVELATNDYIEVFGTSDTNGDKFTVHNLVMTVVKH